MKILNRILPGAAVLLASALGLVLISCAPEQCGRPSQFPDGLRVLASPDDALVARVRDIGRKGTDAYESRIEIYSKRDSAKPVAKMSHESADGAHGRGVMRFSWTANSKYFVYSTISSSDSRPWQFETYVYCRQTGKFYRLDDYFGPITEQNFLLTSSDVITTRHLEKTGRLGEGASVTVSLRTVVPLCVPVGSSD
ncbi:MAG: hypothetical protein PHV34_00400 [Verrucomicrobiae bacterium]|nr:hypothetical protein [Verrucomicrobiae bacterium]